MIATLTATGTALIGFLAGLFLFNVKTRWCPSCGRLLRCTVCAGPGATRGQVRRP